MSTSDISHHALLSVKEYSLHNHLYFIVHISHLKNIATESFVKYYN